ncbi:heterokaryon incompatibility protein-domain-containing protein [Pyrenochaeta sp. MPI-SDFR-AT-0127]|nr:heterokaryon incompatibility protein-domain-containing protein [Pyrenochaeta sp. MPI-SDFR-AT-0127]
MAFAWTNPNLWQPPPNIGPSIFNYEAVPVGNINGIDYIRLLEITVSPGWTQPVYGWGNTMVPFPPQTGPAPGLSCRLISVPLRDGMPSFSALSYTWGAASDRATIRCNDKTLDITRSLHVALETLKNYHPTVMTQYLWADGICINQAKQSEEKAHQIPLMAELYRRATQVIIWLGEDKPAVKPEEITWEEFAGPADIEYAIPAIRKCANAHRVLPNASALTMSMQDWARLGFQSPDELKIQLRAFYRLLQRPWFGRVWTIQEHVVARSVVFLCGRHQISETELMNSSAFLASSGADVLIASWGGNPLIMLYGFKSEQTANAKAPLLNLLAHFRHRDAGDAKDKIYAVLDLAADSGTGPGGLDIKVRKDISVGELYRAVAIKFLCEHENLDIVSLAGRYPLATGVTNDTEKGKKRHAERPMLPSWVPDWSLPDSTVSIQHLEDKKMLRGVTSFNLSGPSQNPAYLFPLDQEPTQFRACGDTKYQFDLVSPDGPGLRVRGVELDQIGRVGILADDYRRPPDQWWLDEPQANQTNDVLRSLERMCNWLDLSGAESGRLYFTGEPLLDVFWQTMRCGHYPHGLVQERKYFMDFYGTMRSAFALYRKLATQPWLRTMVLAAWNVYKATKGTGVSVNFLARTKIYTGNRAMFSTVSKGLVGLAPKGSVAGDSIVILEGGKVPFVVRRCGQYGYWEIIGACYVHGCMHGHAFRAGDCAPMVIVSIYLDTNILVLVIVSGRIY